MAVKKKTNDENTKQTGKVTVVDYSEEMQQSYINYSMSVITDRALPDVRDGMKPVHRRIIYAMADKGMHCNKPYNKCAEIVGEVLGFYHAHGDSSVYDALVRLAQGFQLNYPLIDGHGNFGSVDGDPAAAYRYTEARLQPIADDMVENLKYDTVDMKLSFNEKKKEPVILPATIPLLLINGITGIAVGMMTNIPTHNLKNAIDTVIFEMDNPNSTTKDLLNVLKGPDFPTGGIICNKSELVKIYEDGVGTLIVRGKHNIEKNGNKNSIVITEIPYTLSGKKESFVESIIKLAHEKKELQITSVKDESSKEGIRIVIDVRKDMDVNTVVNYLYKFTAYEDSYKFSFLCLENGKPVTMSLSKYIKSFINFQKEIYKRKYSYIYNKNKIQIEKLKGLLIAYDYIDEIVAIVRNANSYTDMKKALMTGDTSAISNIMVKLRKRIEKFSFSELQADMILEMKVHELSKLKAEELQDSIIKLEKENKRLGALLSSDKKLMEDIKTHLTEMKNKYGVARKTQIISNKSEFKEIVENYAFVVDENNYAKRIKTNEGPQMGDKFCIITDDGGAYIIPTKNVPIGTNKDKGLALENFINGEKIKLVFLPTENQKILIVDDNNYGKIISSNEFICSRKFLKAYLKDSKILLAQILSDEKTINFIGENGKKKTFKISELPELSRTGKGRKIVQGKFKISEIDIK